MARLVDFLISSGKAFHSFGPVTEKDFYSMPFVQMELSEFSLLPKDLTLLFYLMSNFFDDNWR